MTHSRFLHCTNQRWVWARCVKILKCHKPVTRLPDAMFMLINQVQTSLSSTVSPEFTFTPPLAKGGNRTCSFALLSHPVSRWRREVGGLIRTTGQSRTVQGVAMVMTCYLCHVWREKLLACLYLVQVGTRWRSVAWWERGWPAGQAVAWTSSLFLYSLFLSLCLTRQPWLEFSPEVLNTSQ